MLDKFKESVKDFSDNVKSTVAEKELDEETLDPLLEQLRLKLLQNNVSLEAAEAIEKELRQQLLGESVRRGKAEEKVNEAVKNVLLELLDDSFDFGAELEDAENPPVVFMIGFNGSGKCVSHDSLIYTNLGPIKAEELFGKYSHLDCKQTEKGKYVEPEGLKVPSINQESLESELKEVSKLWELENSSLVDISLSTGKKISVTREHPFFRIREGRIVKQTASTLEKGDFVMAPSSMDLEEKEPDFWEKLDKAYYVNSEEVVEELYDLASDSVTLKDLSQGWQELGYSKNAVQYWRRRGKVPLEVLNKLDIGLPSNATFSAPNTKSIELPKKPSEELAEWLGMLVAEGNIDHRSIHIHNKDDDFVERLRYLYKKLFDIEPNINERRRDLYRVSVGKKRLEPFLKDALGFQNSKHSLVEKVSIWNKDCQASFLKGLFSGDGHVSKSKREIELATSEKRTADLVQFMLLNLDILSAVGEKTVDGEGYYRVRINGDSKLRTWKEKIGFNVSYKNRDIDEAIEKNKQYEHTELVPNQGAVLKQVRKSGELTQRQVAEELGVRNTMVHHYENDSRIDKKKLGKYSDISDSEAADFLEKLAQGDVSWLKVKDVEKRDSEGKVYDLTVPDNHNFVAEGLVIHNTTTAAKIGSYLQENGEDVVLGAGDTFRAASIEQLEEHGDNLGVEVVSHEYESDPAAVGYDTVEHAEKEDKIALVDTAGRSHSDQNLMDELDKMVDVNDPDITFLVVDALAGNDVLEQAEAYEGMFDAVIVTKMDVDRNGGAIISISQRSGKPVAFIGTGQGYEDLERFDKEEFVSKILE